MVAYAELTAAVEVGLTTADFWLETAMVLELMGAAAGPLAAAMDSDLRLALDTVVGLERRAAADLGLELVKRGVTRSETQRNGAHLGQAGMKGKPGGTDDIYFSRQRFSLFRHRIRFFPQSIFYSLFSQ